MSDEIKYDVPTSVIQGLEEVHESGKYNMFEAQNVFAELFALEYYEAVDWLLNPKWTEGSYRSQVDTQKYAAALRALADTKYIAEKLAK